MSLALPLPFHVHADCPVPGGVLAAAAIDMLTGEKDGHCHFDLVVDDSNDDGDLELKVKWDLPGTALDSGPDPKEIVLPTSLLKESLEGAIDLVLTSAGLSPALAGLKVFRGAAGVALGALKTAVELFD